MHAEAREETAMTAVNATIASPRMLLVGGGAVRQIAEVLGEVRPVPPAGGDPIRSWSPPA